MNIKAHSKNKKGNNFEFLVVLWKSSGNENGLDLKTFFSEKGFCFIIRFYGENRNYKRIKISIKA